MFPTAQKIPLDWQMVSMNGGEADNESDKQDVSSLLLSSKDVFVQFASFQFGAGRYRLRGYTSKNQQVWINGIEMNDPETGNASWNEWGGLRINMDPICGKQIWKFDRQNRAFGYWWVYGHGMWRLFRVIKKVGDFLRCKPIVFTEIGPC